MKQLLIILFQKDAQDVDSVIKELAHLLADIFLVESFAWLCSTATTFEKKVNDIPRENLVDLFKREYPLRHTIAAVVPPNCSRRNNRSGNLLLEQQIRLFQASKAAQRVKANDILIFTD